MAERKTERINVWLTPDQVAWLKTKKNVSETVRAMVTEAMNLDGLAPAADPGPRVAVGVDEHHVGNVDRRLFLRDPSGDVLGRVGADMPLDHVDALDDHAVIGRQDLQDFSLPAPIPTGHDDHDVVSLQPRLLSFLQRTSGAREMIFMNFLSRSSRATGPNTRVPTGSPSGEIRTAALSSNRMYEPSRRR